MKKKQKQKKNYRMLIKLSLSVIYIFVIGILMFSAYRIYEEDRKVIHWNDIITIEDYAYLNIGEMSEAFAEIGNKTIHFTIETFDDETWRISLIAINKDTMEHFKEIIDYSYERIETRPNSIRVYGYARAINPKLKELVIENLENFIPYDRRFELNEDNFKEYFSNVYLDTTIDKTENINPTIIIILVMKLILIVLFIFTIMNKDKLVDEVDNFISGNNSKN